MKEIVWIFSLQIDIKVVWFLWITLMLTTVVHLNFANVKRSVFILEGNVALHSKIIDQI